MSTVKKQMPANQPWADILLQVPIFQRTCLVSIQLNNSWKEKNGNCYKKFLEAADNVFRKFATGTNWRFDTPLPPPPLPPRSRWCLPNWLFIKVSMQFSSSCTDKCYFTTYNNCFSFERFFTSHVLKQSQKASNFQMDFRKTDHSRILMHAGRGCWVPTWAHKIYSN